MKEFVAMLVKTALKMNMRDVAKIQGEKDLENLLVSGKIFKAAWIGPKVGDQVHTFWRIRKGGVLARRAYIIFTGINPMIPFWNDLKEYESCRFGSIFLLEYDSTTLPGAKPSMRGMWMS